jgi:hypothetical protein
MSVAMRVWLVCRDDRPRAVFSTAEGASDYLADNAGANRCNIQCVVVDAYTRSQRWEYVKTKRVVGSH